MIKVVFILMMMLSSRASITQEIEYRIYDIRDMIHTSSHIQASVSPDGDWIAWYQIDKGICLLEQSTQIQSCYEWPDEEVLFIREHPRHNETSLIWSPDSQKLIFSRNVTRGIAWDTDIWMFEIITHEFNNLTPDGFVGIAAAPDGLDALMDILPVWRSSDHILFARLDPINPYLPETNPYRDGWWRNLRIMQIDLNTMNIEILLDLSDRFADLITMLSVSPDGKKVGLSLYEEQLEETIGIWIYDMDSRQLQQILTYADIQSLLMDNAPLTQPVSMLWTQEGNIILSVAKLKSTLAIDHYINLYFDVENQSLSLISGDLEVFASAYDDDGD